MNINFNQKILKHIRTKIVVVILAFMVWFFVETANNYKYSFKIPMVINNLSSEEIIVNEIPKHVKITVWGKGNEIISMLLTKKFQYNLDLMNIHESKTFSLSPQNVRLPQASNLEVLNIVKPDSVYVKIEKRISKKIPIKPDVEITPYRGYTLVDEILLRPDSVTAIGAASMIDSIITLTTEKVILTKLKRDIKRSIKIKQPRLDKVQLVRDDVLLFADIQKLIEVSFSDIPVNVINKPDHVELTVIPSSLSLILIGGVDNILKIKNDDIWAYIDYNKVVTSQEEYHLAYIDKPEGVRIEDVKPKRFKIIIKKTR